MAAGKSLTDEQNERIRVALQKLLDGQFEGNQSKLAPHLGVTQATVSNFLAGKQGTSWHIMTKIAAMSGRSEDWFLRGIDTRTEKRVVEPRNKTEPRAHPQWARVLERARQLYKHVPEAAWEGAGGLSGFTIPDALTPQYVRRLANTWLELENDAAEAGALSKEQFEAERRKEAEQDQAFEEIEKSGHRFRR